MLMMEDAAIELIDGLLLTENTAKELADKLPLIREMVDWLVYSKSVMMIMFIG